MKRMKKLLTGLLTLGMTLSMMTMTAFAAGPSAKMPTIDTDPAKTGTVTIHKYTSGNGTGSVGNGKEADANDFPTGAVPLKGAGFTLYKVVDKDGMEAYYNTNPTSLPAVDRYVNSDGTIKSEYASGATAQVITDNNGTATFPNLDLGFYVVIETTVPDAVTTPMDPFLLSVPMTTADGTDWLYDIHVYPKNETGYGKISLEKTGVNGEKILGAEFALQKKSDTTSSWINITQKSTAQGDNTGDALILTTDVNGLITIDGLSKGEYRLIETSVGNGYIMDGATAYEFTVNANKKITYKGVESANTKIEVTNERPDLTKEVKKKTGEWGRTADYSIGDEIPYKITVNVPNNITKLKTFTVTDTPTNLTDDLASIKITCNDVDVETTAYTTSATTEGGFTIAFTPANMTNYAGKKLVITYNATLKDTAFNTTAGNQNTAKLEYSKNITTDTTTDPDNPNKDKEEGKNTIENSTVVYTFAVKIVKTGEDGSTYKPLEGVKFDLYQEVDAGTTGAITGASVPAGLDSAKSWKRITTLKTKSDGTVTHNGLSNGTYYLVETETNTGYNLLKKPIEVTLNVQYIITEKATSEWTTDENGQKQEKKKIETTTFTGSDDTTAAQGVKVQTVINKKGFTLPTTGGIGTFVFTFAGIAMMAAAVILLITSKKKKAE